MPNYELYHHGVKGMKWGVRRYQNKDGSLTDLGKKRMYREMFDAESKEAKEQRRYTAEPNRWVREDRERTKQVADSGRTLANDLRTLNRATASKPKKTRMDLSSMSDQEMRTKIQRELIERQYNDLFNPPTVNKGRERVDRTLEVAGSVLGVAASSLTIALAIKKLKDGD